MTTTPADAKSVLHRYLRSAREALVWKVEGLSERDARLPRTPTGTNLLGLVKHAASVEIGYFGDTFGRAWPTPEEVPWMAPWTDPSLPDDPQADHYATADESTAQVLDLYRRVWAFADETIESLPLDAPGRVAWWGDDGATDLHTILLHVTVDLARHAGHADILREQVDGVVGMRAGNTNIPEDVDYPAYTAMLRGLADQFSDELADERA
ncbi:DinB family protein [Isoptericola sp. NPDC057191]|uniref:DinB family protein n=1 Tax=Isoptericola sp. NPDC057191 TaxID=3346041 RepID=UPI003639F724